MRYSTYNLYKCIVLYWKLSGACGDNSSSTRLLDSLWNFSNVSTHAWAWDQPWLSVRLHYTPRLAAAVGTLGNFFRKTFTWPPDFGKKLSSLVPITNSSESSCQSPKHPQNDCRRQSWCSMDRWPGTLHGRDISPGDFYCFYFHCQRYDRIVWGQTG